jgi:hypothetical protein
MRKLASKKPGRGSFPTGMDISSQDLVLTQ